ncbi:MAG: cation diffusion facilitator family transporter [Bacteroidota bacterium]
MKTTHEELKIKQRLKIALLFNTLVVIVEMFGGISANSLGLISDAVHNFVDEATLLLTLYAYIQVSRPASDLRTFGYHRMEVMAAWTNSGALIIITLGLIVMAILRMVHPVVVQGTTMWIIGLIASVGNLGVALVLRKSSGKNLNIRSAYLHNLGDALISLSPVAGGFLISKTGWSMIDPMISLVIGIAIIGSVIGILREANRVLLKGTPEDIASRKVADMLLRMPGVRNVHDLHIWSEGSDLHLLTCQLLVNDMRISEGDQLLKQIRRRLFEDFQISHATLQLETSSCHPQLLYCDLKRRLAHRLRSVTG